MEHGSSPTNFPQWRHHSIWVSAEGRLIDTAIFPRLSLTVKFGFPEQRTGGYGDAIGMRIRRDEKKPVDYSKDDWKLYFLQVRKFLVNFTKEKMQAAVAQAVIDRGTAVPQSAEQEKRLKEAGEDIN